MSRARTQALAALFAPFLLGLGGCGSSESASGALDGTPGGGSVNYENPPAPDPPEPTAGASLEGTVVPAKTAALDCAVLPPNLTVTGSLVGAQATASAGRAREALTELRAPLPAALRRRDFHNYYQARAASVGVGTIAPNVQAQPVLLSGLFTGQWNVFVSLQAGDSASSTPLALIVIVDTSPSMQGVGLGRAKAVLRALSANVRIGDHVSVQTTGPVQAPLLALDVASDADRATLSSAADALTIEEEGALVGVLNRSYPAAEEKRAAGYEPRIVLVGDGEGDPALLDEPTLSTGAQPGEHPILVSAFGTGSAGVYYSRLFRNATSAGRGKYYYIDSSSEAERLFADRWDALWRIALDDVQVSLQVPGMYSVLQDSGDSDDPTSPSPPGGSAPGPQWLAPGEAMTYLFHLEPCAFGWAPDFVNDAAEVTLSFVDPNQGFATGQVTLAPSFEELKTGPHDLLAKMLAVDSYVTALQFPTLYRLQKAQEKLQAAPVDNDVTELLGLLSKHPGWGN